MVCFAVSDILTGRTSYVPVYTDSNFLSYLLAELASEILFLRTYLSFLILILAGNVILVSSTENIPRSWGTYLPVEQRISSIQASDSSNIDMPSGSKTVMWIISVLLTDADILQEFLTYLDWLHSLEYPSCTKGLTVACRD